MADKRIPKKKPKKDKKTAPPMTKTDDEIQGDKADHQFDTSGGMDLSNFRKNLGCG